MSRLTIYLLGSPQIELDGTPITIGRSKAIALLAYLACTSQPVGRDTLATLLWPEVPESRARTSLRTTLGHLTKKIGKQWFDIQRRSIEMKAESGVWLDMTQFKALLAESASHGHPTDEPCPACLPLLAEAVTLYRDDFLAGFSLRDSVAFDEWQRQLADELARAMMKTLTQLVVGHGRQQMHHEAIEYANQLLTFDPLQESVHRQLMKSYAALGNSTAVTQQYETYAALIEQEFGVPPQAKTARLYQELQSQTMHASANPLPVNRPTSIVKPATKANITLQHILKQRTPFFGREAELDQIEDLLANPQCRLLTLVGLGGSGKTRLAQKAAQVQFMMAQVDKQVASLYSDGIVFIPLAPIQSADQLTTTIAYYLQFTFYGSAPPEIQLLNYFRHKRLLLILDNFEHILDGAGFLAEILATAPAVKILVTSRERLRIPEEWLLVVEGMHYPESASTANGKAPGIQVDRYSAIQLFQQRAQRVYANFQIEPNQDCVIQLCQMVSGLPLALELAATQVQLYSCAEIVEKIKENLEFLKISDADTPQRHRSLEAVFTYSWKLLTDEEQETLHRLTIFRGGFTREAAIQIMDTKPHILVRLLDKSLIQQGVNGRYQLHETLRQFAAKIKPIAPVVQEQHTKYYLHFLSTKADDLPYNLNLQETITALSIELGNILYAWEQALYQNDITHIGLSIEGFRQFYVVQGSYREGERLFAEAVLHLQNNVPQDETKKQTHQLILANLIIAQAQFLYWLAQHESVHKKLDTAVEINKSLGNSLLNARIHLERGSVYWRQGQYDKAEEHSKKALTINDDRDSKFKAKALCVLGINFINQADYTQAEAHLQAALEIFQQQGNYFQEVGILNYLSNIAYAQGQLEKALAFNDASRIICKQIDNANINLGSLNSRGNILTALGHYDQARSTYKECLTNSRFIGHRFAEAAILDNIGIVANFQGKYTEAKEYCEASLELRREIQDRRGEGSVLKNLGIATLNQGHYEMAQHYLDESLKISQEVGDKSLELWLSKYYSMLALQLGDYDKAQEILEHSLARSQQLKIHWEEGVALHYLGIIHHNQKSFKQAYSLYNQSVAISEEVKHTRTVGMTLNQLGQLASDEADWNTAYDSYERAQSYLKTIDFTPHLIAAQAGFGKATFALGDVNSARKILNPVCHYLDTHELHGDWWPIRVSLMCWRLLTAWDDPRADSLLQKMAHTIQTQADNIEDQELRRSFLENVPENQEILALAAIN